LLNNVATVLQTKIVNRLIKGDLLVNDTNTIHNFIRYLDHLDPTEKKPSSFADKLDPVYLDIKACYANAIMLMQKLYDLTAVMTLANKEILDTLNTKKKKVKTPHISAFIEQVEELNELISKFKPSDIK
jgi:hypothetical protein